MRQLIHLDVTDVIGARKIFMHFHTNVNIILTALKRAIKVNSTGFDSEFVLFLIRFLQLQGQSIFYQCG